MLNVLDAWGQTVRMRRSLGPSSVPGADEKGLAVGGYSLKTAALHFLSVEKWLEQEEGWVRRLLEAIWVDGWEIVTREVVYYLPERRKEARIDSLAASVKSLEPVPFWEWANCEEGRGKRKEERPMASFVGVLVWLLGLFVDWCTEMVRREEEIANANKEIQELHESMLIVLDASEEAPFRARAEQGLTVRRWTFELRRFDFGGGSYGVRIAAAKPAVQFIGPICERLATRLQLGSTMPPPLPDAQWVKIGWVDGGVEWR